MSDEYGDAPVAVHLEAAAAAARICTRANAAIMRHAFAICEYAPDGDRGYAAEDLAEALGLSGFTAARLITTARAIYGKLPQTADAFDAGDLPLAKASVLAAELGDAPVQVALAVEAQIIPTAAERTPNQLRADIRRLLAELDPESADIAHAVAAPERGVSRMRRRPHGMASFSVVMAAEQATSFDAALDDAALGAIRAGDCRTYRQLRADALAEVMIAALRDGFEFTTSCGEPIAIPPGRISLTVPLEVLARALPDFTPPPTPADTYHEELFGGPPSAPAGRTDAAWLEGYGPINPALAVILAAGGTWRRIVTDTLTGEPLDAGRATYRPPAAIAAAVRARDRCCRGPGCGSTGNLEIDHVHEWRDGGSTSVANLQLLCRRCHRAKTERRRILVGRTESGQRIWEENGRRRVEDPPRPPRTWRP